MTAMTLEDAIRLKLVRDEPGPPCGESGSSPLRKDGQPKKRNKYPAYCYRCHGSLDPEQGVIERGDDGVWRAFCLRTDAV